MAAPLPDLDPIALLTQVYPVGSPTREILLRHGQQVADKALALLDQAAWLDADREFVYQAAMLHDIGICRTRSPKLGCAGSLPYVCHGVEGRAILDGLGFPGHALVCERHVGVGIRADEIAAQDIPLPVRDMLPVSIEERLICYADKFYSKTGRGMHEKRIDKIVSGLKRYGGQMAERFLTLHRFFTVAPDA